jgi:para-aminobenzoate synthetase / 4-amino-4-deoxychorismate lyase
MYKSNTLLKLLETENEFFLFYSINSTKENQFFYNPILKIPLKNLEELDLSMNFLEKHNLENAYICCTFNYELGFNNNYLPIDKDSKENGWVVFFKNKISFNENIPFIKKSFDIQNITISTSKKSYVEKIETIKNHIKNGMVYQVNYSFMLNFLLDISPIDFFFNLNSIKPTEYSVLVKLAKNNFQISFSPELFFKKNENLIITKPMKGTLTISEKDQSISKKNISENYMILDLLRNDLGKISKIGTVKVNDLLKKEIFGNLIQITSKVQSELLDSISYKTIFQSIFPSGSITGAPKKKAMEIIKSMEGSKRGIYTGTIGYIEPNNNSEFNVAIRTFEIINKEAQLGIGSGIVYDSTPESEWRECHQKASFFYRWIQFSIFESLLLKNGKIYRLKEHIQRIEESCMTLFALSIEKKIIYELTQIKLSNYQTPHKLKILVEPSGEVKISINKLNSFPKSGKILISNTIVKSNNLFQFFKTTNRNIYDSEWNLNYQEGFIDTIFFNENNELTEGCITNIFVLIDNIYYTPPIESGILNGVFREKLLKKFPKFFKEKTISKEEFKSSKKIILTNSVRGIIRVKYYEKIY